MGITEDGGEAGRRKQKQSEYFNQLRLNSPLKVQSTPPKPLPETDVVSPRTPPKVQSEYQKYRQTLLRTPTRAVDTSPLKRLSFSSSASQQGLSSPSGSSSPLRQLERHKTSPLHTSPRRSPGRTPLHRTEDPLPLPAPVTFDSSFSTLESPSPKGINSRRFTTFEESLVPDLSPLKRLRTFDTTVQRSMTADSDLSILPDDGNDVLFEEQQLEPMTPSTHIFTEMFNQTISESPSPTKTTRALPKCATLVPQDLPVQMQIIYNSRPSPNVHDMSSFDNLGYVEFWNITSEEGGVFKNWNKAEFERQNTIFELFLHLKKIRFNLGRLVNVYAPQFLDTDNSIKFTKADYDKTFGILEEFYKFLNKLVVTKLKPLYDDNFFVHDHEVLKLIRNWFKLLKNKYDYISGSILYLAQLTSTPECKKWILKISKLDHESQNRSAVSSNELFSSYFIKLFTSVQLLFDRLIGIYKEIGDMYLSNMAQQLESLVKGINNISDSTSDLEKKISFNERLSYKTDIDYSHMEMVDMFNSNRITKDPISVEMKTKLSWVNAILVLFDNYLVPFSIKPNPLNLLNKEGYVLSKTPIPLQYLHLEYTNDAKHKILKVTNGGNGTTYSFRKVNDFSATILDKFVKSIKNMIVERWKKINISYEFKTINDSTFLSKNSTSAINAIPIDYDPASKSLTNNRVITTETIATLSQSIEYFNRRDRFGHTQRYCLVGTSDGLYLGFANKPTSWKLLYALQQIRKMTIFEATLYLLSGTTLHQIPIDKIYEDYEEDFIESLDKVNDDHLKNVNGFCIGYQANAFGIGANYLFTWSDKIVNYLNLSKSGSTWKQFKTVHKIHNLLTIYANNFAVGHIIDDEAQWYISNINEFRFKPINTFDVKDILKGVVPIKTFKLLNKSLGISETLIVYSKFCARFKLALGKYTQCRPDIIWFGTECKNCSFHIDDKVLYIVGKDSCEIYQLYEDVDKKAELVSCFIGNNMRLLNSQSGKVTLAFKNPHDRSDYVADTIVKIRKKKIGF